MTRESVPITKNGVAIPPEISECTGEDCLFRKDDASCDITRHHLHSTKDHYEEAGELATEFRSLLALTVWIPRCQHKIYHYERVRHVPIPDQDVMEQALAEGRLLHEINAKQREVAAIGRVILPAIVDQVETESRLRQIDKLIIAKGKLLDRVNSIEIIPAELVTGALLYSSPTMAQERIAAGSGFVLTGTIKKEDIPAASNTLQTGVNELELAA